MRQQQEQYIPSESNAESNAMLFELVRGIRKLTTMVSTLIVLVSFGLVGIMGIGLLLLLFFSTPA